MQESVPALHAALATSSDPLAQASIGVFDSGVGGLSVLRQLQAALPREHFVYWADSGHAPYGERGDAFVRARAEAIVTALQTRYRAKAVVIACNTATAAAVDSLRAAHPQRPFVGIEPALLPAARQCATGHVGVLATRGTLDSPRFRALAARVSGTCQLHLQACDGLADAIERSASDAGPGSQDRVRELIARYVDQLGELGSGTGQIDTVVLGCTHYPLAWPVWTSYIGKRARLVDPAAAVARQLKRVLRAAGTLNLGTSPVARQTLVSTGDRQRLEAAARRWAPVSSADQR